MQLLAEGEWVEVGALSPPQQSAGVLDNVALPSREMLPAWEGSRMVRGGVLAGQRAGTYVWRRCGLRRWTSGARRCRSGAW